MAASMRVSRCIGLCRKFYSFTSVQARYFSNDPPGDGDNKQDTSQSINKKDLSTEQHEDASESASLSFAEAFAKHAAIQVDEIQQEKSNTQQEEVDFATMLRNSMHIHIGAAKGQLVIGKIFHVVEDDLYIDFGGKFHCVCKRPEENAEKYHRGARVRLRLKDLEVADHFIGATKEFSILEADADLLGLMDRRKPVPSRY